MDNPHTAKAEKLLQEVAEHRMQGSEVLVDLRVAQVEALLAIAVELNGIREGVRR